MKISIFLAALGLGGTEKAAALWANALQARGHTLELLAMQDGPGRGRFADSIPFHEVREPEAVADCLRRFRPDVIQLHAPGFPFPGDVLWQALARLDFKVPTVQTNVFGLLINPADDPWVTGRTFISWTSCVQAAQRKMRPLDEAFFRRATVASYPLPPARPASPADVAAFRRELGVEEDEVLFGKFARPDMTKWSNLALDGFRAARRSNRRVKFLVRELPAEVREKSADLIAEKVLIPLPITSDETLLGLTISSIDVLLHTSRIGESFGYGIAEAMDLEKPVITDCTPRCDQAQVELVVHGETGFLANSPRRICHEILRLAGDADLRRRLGRNGAAHIRRLADPEVSTTRLEGFLEAMVQGRDNPRLAADLQTARAARDHLARHAFGHDPLDAAVLRLEYFAARAVSRTRDAFHAALRRT